MEFCSKYGYDYGFDGSDEEEMNDFNYETNTSTRKQVRKADSNIIAAKFDELVKSNETFAGSFFDCSKCKAIVSSHSLSNITKTNDEKFIWTCEYCSNLNDLSEKFMQSLDEIPDKDDVTFLIEPARHEISNKTNEIKSLNDNHLTYCIDISGSMDTQIQNDDKHTKIQKHRSGISRLNGVQMACLENLTCLKDTEPNRKVSLLTFSEKVKYFGDGTNCNINEPLINTSRTNYKNNEMIIEIPNDILTNKEKMFSLAQNQSKNENLVGLSESYDNLKEIESDRPLANETSIANPIEDVDLIQVAPPSNNVNFDQRVNEYTKQLSQFYDEDFNQFKDYNEKLTFIYNKFLLKFNKIVSINEETKSTKNKDANGLNDKNETESIKILSSFYNKKKNKINVTEMFKAIAQNLIDFRRDLKENLDNDVRNLFNEYHLEQSELKKEFKSSLKSRGVVFDAKLKEIENILKEIRMNKQETNLGKKATINLKEKLDMKTSIYFMGSLLTTIGELPIFIK